MSMFKELKNAVADKLKAFTMLEAAGKGVLVTVHVERDELFNVYLGAIPAEHNQLFRKRPYYEANYDKHFIRNLGGVMFIKNDLSVETIWDVQLSEGNYFSEVVAELSNYVQQKPICNYLLKSEKVAGHLDNIDNYDPNITWPHFYFKLPDRYVSRSVAEVLGKYAGYVSMLKRSVEDLALDAAETVLSLIKDNDLYRGAEFAAMVGKFIELKKQFHQATNKDLWVWRNAKQLGEQTRFRSTVIGTLVEDLTQGVDVDVAVRSFESKVAPTNYKRTTAVVTPMMVDKAKAAIADLGYLESLYREPAVLTDLPTDKMLYIANVSKNVDVFGELSAEARSVAKNVDKAKTITASELLTMLRGVSKVEVLKQMQNTANEFVLTRASDDTAPNMFKWDNTLAWAYVSGTADAIKERVKAAGGNVTGDVRVSLAWHSPCDLDLHIYRNNQRQHLYYSNKRCFGAVLDLDMNGLDRKDPNNPVENAIWGSIHDMPNGTYVVRVKNYQRRTPVNRGFTLQVEVLGQISNFVYDTTLIGEVGCLTLRKRGMGIDVSVIEGSRLSLQGTTPAGGEFLPVSRVMMSPNCWGEKPVGNEHLMFVVDGFKCDKQVRGFFNEYLKAELNEHRKVFEMLGSKLMVETNGEVVGGYGFSLTSKQEFVVRLDGKRIYKVKL